MNNGEIRAGSPVALGIQSEEELRQVHEDILTDPQVLRAGLATLISQYTYTKTEDDYYITPEAAIHLNDGDDASQFTVFAGYHKQNLLREIIYLKDEDTSEVSEWIIFGDELTDGSGQNLASEAGRKMVRQVLDAMKNAYEQSVITQADSFDIRQHLLDTLDERIAAKEAELISLRHQRQHAEQQEEPFTAFKVSIVSGWRNEGESNLDEVIQAPGLSAALRLAADRFKQLNHRSDVQARSISVSVTSGEGQYWPIPNEAVLPLFSALSHWDREAYEVEKVKQEHITK